MSKLKELKNEFKCETTEKLFGFPSPPEYQCGNIDALIKKMSEAEKLSNYRYEDEEELKGKLDDINYIVRYLEDDLEEVRSAIELLREWGQSYKDLLKRVVDKSDIDITEYW